MKVHLVDGTLELFRCFFGAPAALAPDGAEVGATRGFLATLVSLLKEPDVTHVAVAFDTVVDVVRPGRPAQPLIGPGTDPRLRSQHPLAAEAARALGLATWPMIKLQADDALASGAARFKEAPGVEQVVLCTTDKDLAQCVEGRHVILRDRIHKRELDEEGVRAKFGVAPASIPDYLALVGDAADGLPGVPGFGAKSAGILLRRFGRLEEIPADAGAWDVPLRGAARLAAALAEHRLEATLCRNLARLVTTVPIPHELSHLAWHGAHRERLGRLAARLGYPEILGRVPRWRDA